VAGLVDSGADGTLLPKALAPALGIDPTADLRPEPGGSGGAGGTSFPTWTPRKTIQAQVFALLPGGVQPFGPVFVLAPAFAETGIVLWGRCDFFTHFRITFATDAQLGPIFHLEC
jgi:hypothetical protein